MADDGRTLGRVLWVDAGIELLLGLVLLSAPATGLADRMALPPPASDALLLAAGAGLLAAAAVIAAIATRPARWAVMALVAANAAGAVAITSWTAARAGQVTGTGLGLVAGVALALAALAAAEAVLLPRRAQPPETLQSRARRSSAAARGSSA